MQSNVLRNHLEAVGAHEDEIKVLTHSSTEEYQDLLLLLVTGHCNGSKDVEDVAVNQHILHFQEIGHKIGCRSKGTSLALERIMPRVMDLFPGAIPSPNFPKIKSHRLTDRALWHIVPDRVEHMSHVMDVHGSTALDVFSKHSKGISAEFAIEELCNTVESIGNKEPDWVDCISRRNIVLDAKVKSKLGEARYLKAIFRGAKRCNDPEDVLNELAKAIKPNSSRLHRFLSCPFVYGVDPFALCGSSPEEYIASVGYIVSRKITIPPLVHLVMDYFCKPRDCVHNQ